MFWHKYLMMAASIASQNPPPGAHVVGYVRSTGAITPDSYGQLQSYYSGASYQRYATVALALAACVSGRQNIIYVLPGHSESVGTTLMTGVVADTSIIGVGDPSLDSGPTLLWSVASSNLAVATKNVTIANMRLRADADNVTAAITVTAAGFKLINCVVDAGIGSSTDILIFADVGTGADNAMFIGNEMRCTAGGNTALIKMAAAVDDLKIIGNRFFGVSQSTTLGNLTMTAALTNVLIAGNLIDQRIAAGTAALNISDVAATGFVCDNYLGTLANGTPGTEGILLAGSTNLLIHFFENRNSDGLKSTSGALAPVVTT